jgi:DNA-binding MarR family transcriptional regulator
VARGSSVPKRRFPGTPDFVGRFVREAFIYLLDDLNEGLREHYPDVTPAQARIVTLLDREGVRMGALAERAQLTKQSLTELIVGLERQGLVERRPDPLDGRARLVVPTTAGERAMQRGLEVAQTIHRRWSSLIGEDDMRVLMRTLGGLVSALAEEREADVS